MKGNWLNFPTSGWSSRRPPDEMMVPRLRVAVRVISEDEYLTHLAQGPPGPGLYRGEKKFPVIIPDPRQWQIGHLVAEIKRQFKQLYGRDVGIIKYISHGFDDCQLHKDLSVFEHLYDEGRAKKDASDQYVVVKAVYSDGGALREGSVVPDFNDPRHEARPIPAVPILAWSEAPSKSGKRLAEEYDDQYFVANNLPNVKRQRRNDAEDEGSNEVSDEDIVQSLEHDEQMQAIELVLPTSQTVIHDSQSSPPVGPQHPVRRPSLPASRSVSFHPSQDSSSRGATLSATRATAGQIGESLADLSLPTSRKQLPYNPNHGKTTALLTPPSGASKKTSKSETRPSLMPGFKGNFAPAQATDLGFKKPSAVKKIMYDMAEPEDIECSLMSPNSKLATSKKPSRSSSASKSSRGRKENTPDRHRGSIPHSKIVKLMEDRNNIRPSSSVSSRKIISHDSPELNPTTDEDGHTHPDNMFQIQNASVAASQSKERIGSLITTFPTPQNNGQSKNIPSNHNDDHDEMGDDAAASIPPNAVLQEFGDATEDRASLAPEKTSELDHRNLAVSAESSTVLSSNEEANRSAAAGRRRKRKEKSQTHNDSNEAIRVLTVDLTLPQLDTEQSTPVDSPGEQLLEMQASSQKPVPGSQTKEFKKTEKAAKIKQEKQTRAKQGKAARILKSAVNEKKKEKQPRIDQKAERIDAPITIATKVIEAPARFDTASKSPYARNSPPEGSIGLGFTHSPRRPSTMSAGSASLGHRKLFEKELAPTDHVQSDAFKDNESSSDTDGQSSDSTAATPSKQARQEMFQTPHPTDVAKTTPTLQTSESIQSGSSHGISVALPRGMTLEQFEARKKQHEEKIANGEEVPKERKSSARKRNREHEAQADSAVLSKTFSKESASSVAPSGKIEPKYKKALKKQEPIKEDEVAVDTPPEEPRPKKKRASKEESAERAQVVAPRASTAAEKARGMSVLAVEKEQSKANKGVAKAASTPSIRASDFSKDSRSALAKTIQPTGAPTARAAVSVASKPNAAKVRNTLKDLKQNRAAISAKSSPAPQPFAPPPKAVTKKFEVTADSSDDDDDNDDSSSDENDDLEEKRAKLMAASKPDQSTRSALADSDGDMDEDSDEDEG